MADTEKPFLCCSWQELMKPMKIPLDSEHNTSGHPSAYIHLGVNVATPLGSSEIIQKLKTITKMNKKLPLCLIQLFKKNIDFNLCSDYNVGVNILPDCDTAMSNNNLKVDIQNYVNKVFADISARELARLAIIVETKEVDPNEFSLNDYRLKVDCYISEFIRSSVIKGRHVIANNIVTLHKYRRKYGVEQEGFVKVKFTRKQAYFIINGILSDYINEFSNGTELQQLIELLFLITYKLSPTICAVISVAYTHILLKRKFFKDTQNFINSPFYTSAKHGLQRLCRKSLLFNLILSHVKLIMKDINIHIPVMDRENMTITLFRLCCRILSLPPMDTW